MKYDASGTVGTRRNLEWGKMKMKNIEVNHENSLEKASEAFEKTHIKPSTEDLQKLANNILTLENRGLSKLNRRLINGGRGVLDTLAEHNFGFDLLQDNAPQTSIDYEPDEFQRPPDFRVNKNGHCTWIQMKKLSKSERDNRRDKIIDKIKRALSSISVGMFYWCDFCEDFDEADAGDMITLVTGMAQNIDPNKVYTLTNTDKVKATIKFWFPNRIVLDHLTPGLSGDLNVINTTGEDTEHIKNSLCKAVSAYEWNNDSNNTNLIALEADNYSDIDIAEAVFGTEVFNLSSQGLKGSREENGLYQEPNFQDRVAGVIALRRKENCLVSSYEKSLFINEHYKDHLETIISIVNIDEIVCSDNFPEH